MDLLSILAEKSINEIQEKIQSVLESFSNEGIDIKERIYYIEPFYCLNYSVPAENVKDYTVKDFVNIFKFCASNVLYEYIRDYEEPGLIRHIINTNYCCFDIRERVEIYKNCFDILRKNGADKFLLKDDAFDPKSKILQQLADYLKNNTEINLDGFILFRLRDYLLGLDEIVENVAEDFLMDKEYNEFIKLLKYFVEIQESKFDMVHVVFDEETRFKIYDQYNGLLNNDCIRNVAIELSGEDLNQDDLLISALINIAPKQIIVHRLSILEDVEVIRTLQKIFPGKIRFCKGCKWCNAQINTSKE
ncbi:MAG TPA: putative sporulation protein YtxC [Clostridia bacterium]|nr:putative sporulation protein YtxC [Clostridia bacterium]